MWNGRQVFVKFPEIKFHEESATPFSEYIEDICCPSTTLHEVTSR